MKYKDNPNFLKEKEMSGDKEEVFNADDLNRVYNEARAEIGELEVELDVEKVLDILLGKVKVGRGITEKLNNVPRQSLERFAQLMVEQFDKGKLNRE